MGKVGSVGCVCFLVEWTGGVFWWMRLDRVFLVGRTASGGVFWGVCELSMIFRHNEWGCVPVLLVI